MFLRVLCVITSALTVLTTLSMTSCGADNTISSEASESAVTSTADSGKTAKDYPFGNRGRPHGRFDFLR